MNQFVCLRNPWMGVLQIGPSWQFYWVWLFREWGTREARRMSSISIRLLSLDFCSVDSSVWIPHLLWCYISWRSDHLRLQLPHSDESKRSVCIHPPQNLDMQCCPLSDVMWNFQRKRGARTQKWRLTAAKNSQFVFISLKSWTLANVGPRWLDEPTFVGLWWQSDTKRQNMKSDIRWQIESD